MIATIPQGDDQPGAADQNRLAGRVEPSHRGRYLIASLRAVSHLLAMEAVQDQHREPDADRETGHRARGDADVVELHEVAEQRDLAECGEHADRALQP